VRPAPVFKDHPVVLLNCVSRSLHAPSVIPDEREAGRTAIAALIKAGHRTGIYLVGETPEFVLAARERRAGIEAELAEAGLALAGQIATEWWPEPAFDAVNAFLAEGNRPQAFVCLNDRLALGAYQALQEHGLRVGEDVSVVSFDDSELAQWLRPKLTTVAIPHLELARTAVDLLIAGPSGSATHLVQMPLRERESIAGF
jgi:LacI family transcriptional regulator